MISPTALEHARIAAGLSQRELAKRVGLNYQVIRRAELGRPTPSVTLRELAKLADNLDSTVAALLQAPTPGTRAAVYDIDELTVAEARLLRGLQTGRRTTRSLSRSERDFNLPRLHRSGLVALPGLTDGGREAWANEPLPPGREKIASSPRSS